MRDAKAKGLTRYYTGKACPNGHIAERIVSTRACVACAADRKKAWRVANPEKENAQKRAWRDANLEKARALNLANQKKHRASANARNRKYAEANRDFIREKNHAWQQENPGKVLAKAAKRRASERRQMPAWADNSKIELIYRVAASMRRHGKDVHVDHIVPLQGKSVSGLHVHYNLQIIDANANRMKSNQFKEF